MWFNGVMGKTITPKHVVQMNGTGCLGHIWRWKGRSPTIARLQRFVMEYVVSTMPGFCNEHIGRTHGITIPSYACVRVNCQGGAVLVEWKAPMFMLLPDPQDFPQVAKAI